MVRKALSQRGKVLWQIAMTLVFIAACLITFYFVYMAPRRVTPILMYHSIGDRDEGSLCVRWDNFEKQMSYLHKKGYNVISLGQLVENINTGRYYVPKTVAITFDDGFLDNYDNAMPVLSKHKMPATVFVITGYVGKKTGYLNWEQIAFMSKNGFEVGGHTRNNVYLPSASDNQALLNEIKGCKEDIETNTNAKVRFFAYPLGAFDERTKSAVKLAGYKGACTTNRGKAKLNEDVYELKRVKITNSDTNKFLSFEAKLSGYYNLFRRERQGD